MRAEALRTIVVLLPLSLAQPSAATAGRHHVALCGGGTLDLPVPGRRHDDPCPTACHAATCERGRPGGAKETRR